MTAYYNEIDPHAAQWLRNLIDAGHIAPGVVDERSIEDVRPDEIAGYTQCHFFAGIGVWSLALRRAGWPDDQPVWTGSCPCQPFSAAGKGAGFADERHLWPAFHWLIEQCRPPVLFGEQVASKIVDDWLDVVSADLEGLGFAIGAAAFPSAGVGAPHIRDRAYFMAHANHARPQGRRRVRERAAERTAGTGGMAGVVADTERGPAERQRLDVGSATSGMRSSARQQRVRDDAGHGSDSVELADAGRERLNRLDSHVQQGQQGNAVAKAAWRGIALELADTASTGRGERSADALRSGERSGSEGLEQRTGDVRFLGRSEPAGPTNGFWRDADWLLCRDEKWRPVEPGTFPLVDGAPARVGRLRAYGNAIVAPQAEEFIRVAMECLPCEA